MNAPILLPEDNYRLTERTCKNLQECFLNQETITGLILMIDIENRELRVELGIGIIGYLPIEEVTIQSLQLLTEREGKERPAMNLINLVGHKVRVKITAMYPRIMLSRKANMLEVKKKLFQQEKTLCKVVSICQYAVFCDCGDGFVGMIHISNLSFTRYDTMEKYIKPGDKFYARFLEIDKESYKITLSRKEEYKDTIANYSAGQIVNATVCTKMDDQSGYYVEINPAVIGIMDITNSISDEFPEGTKVVVLIKAVVHDGQHLKLQFIKLV